MNWDRIKGQWRQLTGRQSARGKATDDDRAETQVDGALAKVSPGDETINAGDQTVEKSS